MTDLREAFCFFLRRGLGDMPQTREPELVLTREEWKLLFRMASVQAVSGIFIDGVASVSLRPDRDLWEQWIAHLFYLEQINERIAGRGEEWVGRLAEAGIRAQVFKGSSVAAWYPYPLHRSFGDIDLVVEEGWQKLEEWLHGQGVPFRNEWGDLVVHEGRLTTVEFHPHWEYLYNPVMNVRLQDWLKEGSSNELYLVCLIVHLRRHFLTYGIGLKQVCDVTMMLRRAHLNQSKSAYMLERLRLKRFCRVLFGFIDTYLGGAESYPFVPLFSDKDFALMREVIFHEGYLLKQAQEEKGAKERFPFVRIGRHAWFWMRRSLRLGGMMPDEACWFLLHQVMRRVGF